RFGLTDSMHPPLMTLIWRALDSIYPGPALMLLFNASLFLLALVHLIGLYSPSRRLTLALLFAVAFCSVLLGPLATVWKDVTMLAFFAAGAAALAHSTRKGGVPSLVLALVFLLLGSATRHDALAAAVPLFLWWSWRAAREVPFGPRQLWVRVGYGFSVSLALGLMIPWALNAAAGGRSAAWTSTALFDLIGTSRYAGVNLLPPAATARHEIFTQQDIERIYSVDHINHSLVRLPLNAGLKLIDRRIAPRAVKEAWIHAVTAEPWSYLRHRLGFALNFIGLTRDSVFYPSSFGINPNDLGIRHQPSQLTLGFVAWARYLAGHPLAQPWIYYLLALGLVVALLLRRTPGREAPLALLGSAVAYLLAASLIMPAADLRYQIWSLAAAMSTSILSVCLLSEARRPKAADSVA
ncbi:MAG: hypothetical protein AAF657_34625, partial [Acidobacteriota bacterium]